MPEKFVCLCLFFRNVLKLEEPKLKQLIRKLGLTRIFDYFSKIYTFRITLNKGNDFCVIKFDEKNCGVEHRKKYEHILSEKHKVIHYSVLKKFVEVEIQEKSLLK